MNRRPDGGHVPTYKQRRGVIPNVIKIRILRLKRTESGLHQKVGTRFVFVTISVSKNEPQDVCDSFRL